MLGGFPSEYRSTKAKNVTKSSSGLSNLWPVTQSWPFHALALWTICANLQKNLLLLNYRIHKFHLFQLPVILTFDLLLTPKVDRFMPLPWGPLVPICSKIGSFVCKISYSQDWVCTNGCTVKKQFAHLLMAKSHIYNSKYHNWVFSFSAYCL